MFLVNLLLRQATDRNNACAKKCNKAMQTANTKQGRDKSCGEDGGEVKKTESAPERYILGSLLSFLSRDLAIVCRQVHLEQPP